MAYSALLDANVLHPMVLCDLLIRLAHRGLFRALWSHLILQETLTSVQRRFPALDPSRPERRIAKMKEALPDAEVLGFEDVAATLTVLGKDAHVLAAAIVGRADAIVTANLKDFPDEVLSPYGIAVVGPDAFLVNQYWLDPDGVCDVLRAQSNETRRPHLETWEILDNLGRISPEFCALIRPRLVGR